MDFDQVMGVANVVAQSPELQQELGQAANYVAQKAAEEAPKLLLNKHNNSQKPVTCHPSAVLLKILVEM